MLSYRTLTLRAGLSALVAMVGLAQTRMPEATRSEVERAQDVGTQVVRTQVEPVTNWATPLYWQPGAAAAQAGARAKRAEATGPQDSTPTSGLGAPAVFVAITPCRLVDTRVVAGFTGAFGPPAMPANTARTIPVPQSDCAIPAAVAYSLNLTVVPAPGVVLGWAAAWPDDQPQPNTAVLSDMFAGTIVSNSAIVPAGADGGFDVLTLRATDLVIDINGYFALPETLPFGGTALAPALTFGDTTTGLYSTGAGSVSIATNGVNALTIGPTGNLDLPGSITKGGTLFLHDLGSGNTAAGMNALGKNAGSQNTAIGTSALQANTTGIINTAAGFEALSANTTGSSNAAFGELALTSNTTGTYNVGIGAGALQSNTTGYANTAVGNFALQLNTGGDGTETENGWGSENTAIGHDSMSSNTTGFANTAVGEGALANNTTGSINVAVGQRALEWNTSGIANIAICNGSNLTTGNFNIDIGCATAGVAGEGSTIRIGEAPFQTRAFIAGIRGVTTGSADAIPVVIDSNGQLGTVSSSRRVKSDIHDMRDTTETIMSLHPVEFRYTAHGPEGPVQFGLVAEEVAEVAPELVAHKPDGEIETVFYDKVNAMLLKQVQQQQRTIDGLKSQNETLAEAVRKVEARLAALEAGGAK